MPDVSTWCIKHDDGGERCTPRCIHCKQACVRNGKVYGKQRYKCKSCKRAFVEEYTYKAYEKDVHKLVASLVKVGVGIRGIAHALKICTGTVSKYILEAANAITKPVCDTCKTYEVDELHTFVGNGKHEMWVIYVIDHHTRRVVDFTVGDRSKPSFEQVLLPLLKSRPVRIYTDRHSTYKAILPKAIHRCWRRCTNHIERKHLSLRTHLKRLSQRTICFSRSLVFLYACLKIYFWT